MNISTWLFFTTILICLLNETWSKPHKQPKTHDILTKIGFSKIKAPSSHHRKRLAVESRQHTRSDDSHMYVIKLPPNQHYYVRNKPNALPEDTNSKKNVPVGFKNNGKPAKIYHWNLPVLKKIALKHHKNHFNDKSNTDKINHDTNNDKMAFFNSPNSWNDVLDKSEIPDKVQFKKQSFYIPTKPKKSSFFKYFPGNGKPKSFYVIEKSKKKAHYHKLLD
ncbi:uncharacterized protein [Onthophagus taurus]|uniref:uncharacterized protein n=1 Tax=Onthophagus taurus TaxID=166361 RepID=UPI0039BE9A12